MSMQDVEKLQRWETRFLFIRIPPGLLPMHTFSILFAVIALFDIINIVPYLYTPYVLGRSNFEVYNKGLQIVRDNRPHEIQMIYSDGFVRIDDHSFVLNTTGVVLTNGEQEDILELIKFMKKMGLEKIQRKDNMMLCVYDYRSYLPNQPGIIYYPIQASRTPDSIKPESFKRLLPQHICGNWYISYCLPPRSPFVQQVWMPSGLIDPNRARFSFNYCAEM